MAGKWDTAGKAVIRGVVREGLNYANYTAKQRQRAEDWRARDERLHQHRLELKYGREYLKDRMLVEARLERAERERVARQERKLENERELARLREARQRYEYVQQHPPMPTHVQFCVGLIVMIIGCVTFALIVQH